MNGLRLCTLEMKPRNEHVREGDACGIRNGTEHHTSEIMPKTHEANDSAYCHHPSQRKRQSNTQQKTESSEMIVAEQDGHHANENEREHDVRVKRIGPEEIVK